MKQMIVAMVIIVAMMVVMMMTMTIMMRIASHRVAHGIRNCEVIYDIIRDGVGISISV